MINIFSKYFLFISFSLGILLSNDNFHNSLKNDNDFILNINLSKKKYNNNDSKTVFSIWKKYKNSNSFTHLNLISSIKYQDIVFESDNIVLINGKQYHYSNIVHTNKNTKKIKNNELVDIYILFDLICSVQTKDEISIQNSNLNYQHTPNTETIIINKNLIPKDWKIPEANLDKKWGFNDYIHVVSPNQLNRFLPWETESKISKSPIPLILTITTMAAIIEQQKWVNHYETMSNNNQGNPNEYSLANHKIESFTYISIGLSIPTLISIYDWIVND